MDMQNHEVIDQKENKSSYLEKMDRQVREAEKEVKTIEKLAKDRHADSNSKVKMDLHNLRQKLGDVKHRVEALEDQPEQDWAQVSRDVSGAYKDLQNLITTASDEVKAK